MLDTDVPTYHTIRRVDPKLKFVRAEDVCQGVRVTIRSPVTLGQSGMVKLGLRNPNDVVQSKHQVVGRVVRQQASIWSSLKVHRIKKN